MKWLFWPALFAAAFGVVEGAVVVYLREIYYPGGFAFPLRDLDPAMLRTELIRETATLLLLLGAACATVRGAPRRFAMFSFCFGIWDLVYYVALKAFLDWPQSLLDWDVLFLIPVPWTAPVLAPVLVSLALVTVGAVMLREPEGRDFSFLRTRDWAVAVAAGVAIMASFFANTPAIAAREAPASYPWPLFGAGWLLAVGWFWWRWSKRT